ncbi:divergent polysaccharide deacetylase family protein [Aurantimonas sp. HBX-1]|uniref:divergent polysaccharide deacetylase family protein n=1 Tax=Aurantimonas sp. HBX-1 TaxID=2906072 RepID=UPI001F3ED75A|nr:divergent polysaccharide deacetylase family protein [Aurantimonas sp. HBX-1]UIJ72196.1 divergent polysaccharide deacetylase family protein [Aurantimonas sp. HBX-1]
MRGELHRPLGLDIGSDKPRRSPSVATVAGLAVAAVLVAGSLATALVGQPTRRTVDMLAEAPAPQPVAVVAAPQKVAASPLPTIIRPPAEPVAGGVGFRIEEPMEWRQPPGTAHLPDAALIEDSEFGPLPIRGPDGRRPFDVYAGASRGLPGTRIAIVVGGLGISQTGTMNAIEKLPAGVTFGFSPAGNSLDRWMQEARRAGHELVLQVPLEPVGYPEIDPGPDTLTVADAAANRFEALHATLATLTNYVGVMSYMGGRFTGEATAIEPLVAELGRRGLMFLDDASSPRSLAKDTAALQGVPFAAADLTIDRTQDPADIRRQLDMLEQIARAEGTAVGVASAFDVSIATIAAWIGEVQGRGVEIVPVSALANDPEGR